MYNRLTIIQVDYAFLTALLTATDVSTGMSSASIVECKGDPKSLELEPSRFIRALGHTHDALQCDKESYHRRNPHLAIAMPAKGRAV